LFLGVLCFSGYYKWDYFLDFFLSPAHHWYIKQVLIFVHWFCILLPCQKCSSDLCYLLIGFRVILSIRYYHLQRGTIWLHPSLFVSIALVSLVLLLWLQNSNSILDNIEESEHLCLIPDCIRNYFSFSQLTVMLAIGLSLTAFILLRYNPSIPYFFRVFIMKGCWILSEAFSMSIYIMWFLSLILLMWCIIFVDLHILNHPCITGMKLTW
jgi:hypothetical protein